MTSTKAKSLPSTWSYNNNQWKQNMFCLSNTGKKTTFCSGFVDVWQTSHDLSWAESTLWFQNFWKQSSPFFSIICLYFFHVSLLKELIVNMCRIWSVRFLAGFFSIKSDSVYKWALHFFVFQYSHCGQVELSWLRKVSRLIEIFTAHVLNGIC